jgi:hypothetical protein
VCSGVKFLRISAVNIEHGIPDEIQTTFSASAMPRAVTQAAP